MRWLTIIFLPMLVISTGCRKDEISRFSEEEEGSNASDYLNVTSGVSDRVVSAVVNESPAQPVIIVPPRVIITPRIESLTTTCGNGEIEAGEECDDGNNADFDGCSAVCLDECGEDVVDA